MPPLAERQRTFAAALVDPARDVPAGLVGPDGQVSLKRFSVYRNNVIVGLIDALEAAYPAISRIVGEEFFRAMARAYAVAHPPTSAILLAYGGGFADFIVTFEPARSLPYLADVARIERAWLEAYHASEATSLSPAALVVIPQEEAGNVRLFLHPSFCVVRSRFPALTIWRMNVHDGVPAPVDLEAGGEDVLILRPEAEVEVRSMPPGGAEFVNALAEGYSLAEAAKIAIPTPDFDLAANLAALLGAGAFIEYELAGLQHMGQEHVA
ncbi:MAG: putative DNA-binding domain-containing protein [Alphaproteobacteria bacterium]|nr:putative DNA-binding domain-containing protein [Alphaproteobacteria bacterium]